MILQAIKEGFAEALGFVILLPLCIFHLWTEPVYDSIKPETIKEGDHLFYRDRVDQWRWNWVNRWYANTEDGVSGQYAIVYIDSRGNLGLYPDLFPRWTPRWLVAYCWSAWRNGANNVKRPYRTDGLTRAYPY